MRLTSCCGVQSPELGCGIRRLQTKIENNSKAAPDITHTLLTVSREETCTTPRILEAAQFGISVLVLLFFYTNAFSLSMYVLFMHL